MKLNRAFIGELEEGTIDAAIVRAMIALTTEQDLRLVAEGVETETEGDLLRTLGCTIMQGLSVWQGRLCRGMHGTALCAKCHSCAASQNQLRN